MTQDVHEDATPPSIEGVTFVVTPSMLHRRSLVRRAASFLFFPVEFCYTPYIDHSLAYYTMEMVERGIEVCYAYSNLSHYEGILEDLSKISFSDSPVVSALSSGVDHRYITPAALPRVTDMRRHCIVASLDESQLEHLMRQITEDLGTPETV